MAEESKNFDELAGRVVRGDRAALAELFGGFYPRLWRIVQFRLHPKLRGRFDADDVLQEAWLRAERRIGSFLVEANQSCFIWFRMIVTQALIDLHRRHLGTEKRDATRECSLQGRWSAESTASSLAFALSGHMPSPSSEAAKAEQALQLDDALTGLSELDREVLVLRHFEELTNGETALVLEISEQAASARYVRALERLKQVMNRRQMHQPVPPALASARWPRPSKE